MEPTPADITDDVTSILGLCCAHRGPPAVAVLDPVQVDHAEGRRGDAGRAVVVVLVNVQIEGGVAVHVAWPQAGPQGLPHGLVQQPLLQLTGAVDIVDDALVAGDTVPLLEE